MPLAADELPFDISLAQEEYDEFVLRVGDAIFASPVDAPGRTGLLSFDIGLVGTGVPVDEAAPYWQAVGAPDILVEGRLPMVRGVVSKGFSLASASISYGEIPDTGAGMIGGSLDIPIMSGGLVRPTIAVRGIYSELTGVDNTDLRSWGAIAMIGKRFAIVTPWAGIGYRGIDAKSEFDDPVTGLPFVLESDQGGTIVTVGARLSLLFPVLAVEAIRTEDWTYSARIGFGF